MNRICRLTLAALLLSPLAALHAADESKPTSATGEKERHFTAKEVFNFRQPVIFQDDFQSGRFDKWNFSEDDRYRISKESPERIAVVDAPLLAGRKAVRFAVNRAPNSFRSEISLPSEKGFTERWYGERIFIPKEWVFDSGKGNDIVMQWHAISGNGKPTYPNLEISIGNDRWFIRQSFGSAQTKPTRTNMKLDEPLKRGVWTSWVIHAMWSPNDDGLLQIWKDGKVVFERKGPNVYGTIGVDYTPYLKTGIYHPEWHLDKDGKREAFDQEHPVATNKVIFVTDVKVGSERAKFVDVAPLLSAAAADDPVPYFLANKAQLYREAPRKAALAWFEETRLGMFIHWGVWGKHHAAWAMFNERIPLDAYQKMAREVDATGFDATAFVRLAEDSGMRYITFVAKHHDGFCLWDSKATDWDSMDYPMHRDFVAELAKACRERGMPLFIYYSIGIDWTHPYYLPKELYAVGRPGYAVTPPHFKYSKPEDFEKYREFCKQQLTELCTSYGPVAGFWFDTLGGVLANSEMFKMQEFYDLIHQYQPHALIHFKTGATGTEDVLVGERELKSIAMHYGNKTPQDLRIRKLADEAWSRNFEKKAEIAVTSQGTWEWGPKRRCQDVDALWKMLVNAADNNANLLLNFGPKPDGSIPEDVGTNFRLLGKRLRDEGYPALNRTTYRDKRKQGSAVDKTETEKTAR